MSKKSKDKGSRTEREAAALLHTLWPAARRGRQYQSVKECDIEDTPIRWECKAWKQYPQILSALKQVEGDGNKYEDTRPRGLILKKDRTPWIVVFSVRDFVKLWRTHVETQVDD